MLSENFYKTDALKLAQDLLGKLLIRNTDEGQIVCRIIETEAYMGVTDKAAHSYGGKRTARTKTMYLPGGHAYVYFIYGMHYCLNIIANEIDIPEGVMIRAVQPISGLELIRENRGRTLVKIEDFTNGPGKLCKSMKIDKELNGECLYMSKNLYLEDDGYSGFNIIACPRINIDYAEEYKEKPWRFFIEGNPYISRKK